MWAAHFSLEFVLDEVNKAALCPHRHIGGGLDVVELQLQRVVPPVQGADSLRPDGGDVVPLVELPVEGKDPVEIQSQTAAVVHHHPELLPLWTSQKEARSRKVVYAIPLNHVAATGFKLSNF